jgi:hypothetical protein
MSESNQDSLRAGPWEAALAAGGVTLQVPSREAGTAAPRAAWPIRLLAGIGGFIGGVMILLFLGSGLAALRLFESPESAVFIGLVLCGVAVAVYRSAGGSVSAEQSGLAVSIAAQLALGIGVAQLFKSGSHPQMWPQVMVQAVMLLLVANGLHRTLLAAAIVVLGSLSCRSIEAAALWWTLLALGVVLWMRVEGRLAARGQADAVAPVAFGALAGLLVMQWPWWFGIWGTLASRGGWPWHWAAALPALVLAAWLFSGRAGPVQRVAACLLAAAAGVLGVWLPAWTAALLLAVLGLACARPGWAVVAVLAMVWAVWRFYYDLHITLLEKAAWMAAAGGACLALAAVVHAAAPWMASSREPGAST